jgi:hypothetical protein
MSDTPKPARGPQWANSYESQLSDADLHWLHTALLARKPSDKEIRAKMPVWRDGPRKGQPVSSATLSNIRDRLELEEDLRGAEQTTETILDELKREQPGLSQEALDAFGQRTFTTLAIQRRDVKAFVALMKSRKEREALELDKSRFRRETCALFIQWAADQRALDIAAKPTSNADKIEQLGQLMFGEDWKAQEAKPA